MTIRSWLQSLQQVTQKTRALVSRCGSKFIALFQQHHPTPETGAIVTVEQSPRTVRVLCSEVMQVSSYRAWIASLQQLPADATVAELQAAVAALPDFHPAGQHHFPLEAYLQAMSHNNAAWVHFGRAEKQTSLAWFGATTEPDTEPAVLLVQNCEQEMK